MHTRLLTNVIYDCIHTYITINIYNNSIIQHPSSAIYYVSRFPHCGITKDDIDLSDNVDMLTDLGPILPNIFDAAGMGDVDQPETEEILKLLFAGQ